MTVAKWGKLSTCGRPCSAEEWEVMSVHDKWGTLFVLEFAFSGAEESGDRRINREASGGLESKRNGSASKPQAAANPTPRRLWEMIEWGKRRIKGEERQMQRRAKREERIPEPSQGRKAFTASRRRSRTEKSVYELYDRRETLGSAEETRRVGERAMG